MKRLMLVGITLLSTFLLQAQTTIKPTVGLNFTDWSKSGSGDFDYKAKAGWQIGASVAFGKKLYIEPGLFYVGKNTEVDYNSTGGSNNDFEANLNGIRVPVAVGINFLGNEKTALSLRGFGGLSGFFITSNETNDQDINKAQWGTFVGAGVDIWKIFVDLSYEWSLTNIQKDVSQIDLGKTRTIFINAGIRINL